MELILIYYIVVVLGSVLVFGNVVDKDFWCGCLLIFLLLLFVCKVFGEFN